MQKHNGAENRHQHKLGRIAKSDKAPSYGLGDCGFKSYCAYEIGSSQAKLNGEHSAVNGKDSGFDSRRLSRR